MKRAAAVMALSALLAGCSLLGIRDEYEQPAYEVIEKVGEDIELRRYAPRLAAEVVLEPKPGEDVCNTAFRILFDYIAGANRAKAEIAMTAPVAEGRPSQEIAMTTPVESATGPDGRYSMRFFLPASFSEETAPQPTDPRVRIVAVPAATVAVLRYTGSTGEEKAGEQRTRLLTTLGQAGWRPVGPPVAYFYDPPWTVPFLRRNEAAVRVESQKTR